MLRVYACITQQHDLRLVALAALICLLAAYASVLAVRRLITGHEFLVVALWYGVSTAVAFGVGFMLMTMAAGQAPSLFALGWQYIATLILFPFAHRLIERYEDADVRFR